MYQTITVAVLVLMLGKVLKKKFGILERFCIPAPVIGGVVFAVFTCICYVTGIAEFSFDDIFLYFCRLSGEFKSVKKWWKGTDYFSGTGHRPDSFTELFSGRTGKAFTH